MNNKSVIENPKRLTALLKEKIAYDESRRNYSVLNETLEYIAKISRVEVLRRQLEIAEKRKVLLFFNFIESGEITIEKAAKYSDMTVETFKNRLQEIKDEKECAETDNNESESTNYKPLSESKRKAMFMRYINDGYSIPTVAAYFYNSIESVEQITGLKSEVSQLEYDIINDLLKYRRDVKKEDIIAAITDLINEGILSVSEAADRMKMNLKDFLTETGLNEKCSSDGKLMIRTSIDKIIDKCMNCIVPNVNTTDIGLFCYLLNNRFYNLYAWLADNLEKTPNEGDACSE